ncbi:hypothetical protein B0T18DRAFT_434193 [Schizothecium vesticola]|uniref:CRIB domain-containing protein n=1 Tax=Schizothecium vesticola TaxID=314040 RepID=A0AA40KBS9_9PEZI|nr:hypothetical protein B0T18DRAFT_434193 [Schizothecium vesticola]
MNGMWAVSELPVYAVEPRRKPTKKSKYLLGRSRTNSSATVLVPSPSQTTLHNDADSLRGLLDPAVDGPPSPESLRVAMKQTIAPEQRQSHHTTTSSGSSSLRSLTSTDRPSWENALESLSRKSSGRSTTGAMPSRERPDSVQIFGKTLFNRRGKLKRESSAPSSSAGSSLYSTENGGESMPPPAVPGSRDSVVPSLFGRRRTTTLETAESATRKKFHISGPYNFQHVAHTQRDAGTDAPQTDRSTLAAESAQLRASHTTPRGHDLHFADFSSDFLPLREEDELPGSHRLSSLLPKQTSPPRRLLKHSQSQEHLRQAPPRPPRSPVDPTMLMPAPPVPPPRMSSRTSTHPDGLDPLDVGSLDRPLTSSSFRQPQLFALSPTDVSSPSSASQGYFPDMDTIPEHGHARKDSFPGDSNWPLPATPSYESPLPNVPEEDESPAAWRPSHASSEEESPRRPPSNASDTLGKFDLVAAQQALKAALLDGNRSGSLTREDWEDDIDYVYEHAAEADCEYAWDRPSLDLSRDCETASSQASPAMLTPAQFDVPALSPVSQMSAVTAHEAITPTLFLPRASNFSLPRADVPSSLQPLQHLRKPSDASSFKESHGFNLSPSLLIPNDYQLQMMAAEADAREFAYHPFDEPALALDTSMQQQYRTSASTTGTFESGHSGFEKHTSAASSSTDFTRLTASTGSLDTESFSVKAEALQPFPVLETHAKTDKVTMPTLPETEEAGFAARGHFGGRSSESNLKRFVVDDPLKRKDSIIARRQRARTTSLSTPPPANQYALFPSSHLSGARI